jgi:cytochrome b6
MNRTKRIKTAITNVNAWLHERLPIGYLMDHLKIKQVPRHKHTVWYYFGGLTLFFFIVQIVTGILLMLYYKPTPDEAYKSIVFITNEVTFGWLIRSVHSWAANLMIAMLLIHMGSVFFLKAYRQPRELLWFSGLVLLALILGFGFTGYLLPWDEVAYHATQIGTEIPKSIPIIGPIMVLLLRGGDEIGSETLTRMFTLHVVVLPLLAIALVCLHVYLNQYYGASKPINTVETGRAIQFYPNFVLRDLRAWSIALLLLLSVSIILPWGLGPEANPLAPAPEGIKPEWYFLPLYQTLKFVPARLWRFNGEALVNIAFGIGAVILFLLPFLDRRSHQEKPGILIQTLGVIIILYLIGSVIIAYLT